MSDGPADLLDLANDSESSGGADLLDLANEPAEAPGDLLELSGFIDQENEKDFQENDAEEKRDFRGRQRPHLISGIKDMKDPTFGEIASSTGSAISDFYNEPHGWLEKTFYGLNIPQQFMARQVVNGLQEIGKMDAASAKEMLQSNELNGHDIVNFYWNRSRNKGENAMRWLTGLGADIVLDPLSYVGIGLLTKAGKGVKVLGQSIKGLEKMAASERAFFRALPEVERIVTDAGMVSARRNASAKTLTKAIDHNKSQLSAFLNNRKLGMDDLTRKMSLSKEGRSAVEDTIRKHGEMGWAEEFENGYRGIGIGIHIPFSNMAWEITAPRMVNQMTGKAMIGMMNGAGKLGRLFGQIPGVGPLSAGVAGFTEKLFTRTGYHYYDDAKDGFLGDRNLVDEVIGKWETETRKKLKVLKGNDTLLRDLVDELELGLSDEEISEILQKRKKHEYVKDGIETTLIIDDTMEEAAQLADDAIEVNPNLPMIEGSKKPVAQDIIDVGMDEPPVLGQEVRQIEGNVDPAMRDAVGQTSKEIPVSQSYRVSPSQARKMLERNADDLARLKRLEEHPELIQFVREVREMNKKMVGQFADRKVPFEELNPFGPGWARSYLKHMVAGEWIDKWKQLDDALDEADKFLGSTQFGKIDKSSGGRKYRGTLNAANDKSLAEHGVKLFVDDPIELHARRMKEMARIVRNYDLMESAAKHAKVGKSPGPGWVQFDVKDWKNYVMKLTGKAFDDADESHVMFMPKFFKDNKHIHLPEAVHDDLLHVLNKRQLDGDVSNIATGIEFFNKIMRNTLLFGPGYLGMNAMSNATTYISSAGVKDPVRSLWDAAKMMRSKSDDVMEFVDHEGRKYQKTVLEVWEDAVRHNVIGSDYAGEMDFEKIVENVASNYQHRKTTGQKLATVADYAFLWKYSRDISQFSDSLPKLAIYIDRLKQGYTSKGAAEVAERYMYNFNNMTRQAGYARAVYPFVAFPMKSAEMMIDSIKNGQLGRLTIPYKVNDSLEGAFVDDEETRLALNAMLPEYRKFGFDPIHGPIMGGGKEILLEMPWAKGSLNFFFNPDENAHPLVQMMGAYYSSKNDDAPDFFARERFMSGVHKYAKLAMPSAVRETLGVMELNGTIDMGGFFADEFSEMYPSPDAISSNSPAAQRFDNAVDAGKFFQQRYGDDWMYNLWFHDDIDFENNLNPLNRQKLAQRGNYIQKRFRDLTLGLATITKLDVNFMMADGALRRQQKTAENKLYSEIAGVDALVDAGVLTDDDRLKKIAEKNDTAKRLLAVKFKREGLKAYYDFVLKVENEYPDGGLWNLLFDADNQYKMDVNKSAPGEDAFRDLMTTKDNYNDTEAGTLIEAFSKSQAAPEPEVEVEAEDGGDE